MIDHLILGEIRVVERGRFDRPNQIGRETLEQSRDDTKIAVVLLPRFYLLIIFQNLNKHPNFSP